jgi:hypothetical protein
MVNNKREGHLENEEPIDNKGYETEVSPEVEEELDNTSNQVEGTL